MTLRQRQPLPTSSSTPPPTAPDPSRQGVKLPWYQYPLNVILAITLRFLGKFGFYLHNKRYKPNGIPVTRIKKVQMRDGYEVILHIYEPSQQSTSTSKSSLRPCVINFHGGGFTIGSGTDDSRWALWCTRTTEASRPRGSTTSGPSKERSGLGGIFISIEYRLSPEYPHPTPVNDCIDATTYIINNTKEFGIDLNQVLLSGFSAGGSLAVTTALALSSPSSTSSLSTTTTTTTTTETTKNPIAGVVAFYPVLDFNTPRLIKRQQAIAYTNSHSTSGGGGSEEGEGRVIPLPGWMTRMFDTSYLPPHLSLDRKDPMISPGLAPSSQLEGFPNVHLVLCGADVLAHEGRVFGERLRDGKRDEC